MPPVCAGTAWRLLLATITALGFETADDAVFCLALAFVAAVSGMEWVIHQCE